MTDRNILAIVENEVYGITEEDGCPNCGNKVLTLQKQMAVYYKVDLSKGDSHDISPAIGGSAFETVICPKCGRKVQEDGTVITEGENKSGVL